jgi:hypothetical protein
MRDSDIRIPAGASAKLGKDSEEVRQAGAACCEDEPITGDVSLQR